jgi:hypothetical protein
MSQNAILFHRASEPFKRLALTPTLVLPRHSEYAPAGLNNMKIIDLEAMGKIM